jgi:hypothetical protein
VRLQVALGCPRDLLPCGFHSNALWQISFWLFRRVCPIQPYFLRFISTSISDCPVLSHSSSLDIFCGRQIPRMFRRHLLTKAWSFYVVLFVTNQVSQPYSMTDLTQALNNLILRCKLMLPALQTFFSLENAPLALCILCWKSKSVPPFSVILDPRYKKSSTRSIASFLILKASVVLLFTRRSLVFSMLTLSPTFWDAQGWNKLRFSNQFFLFEFGDKQTYFNLLLIISQPIWGFIWAHFAHKIH